MLFERLAISVGVSYHWSMGELVSRLAQLASEFVRVMTNGLS
jgi:hypothetical protein